MRRLIAARRRSPAFGRGSIEFLNPRNQSVLAYVRRWQDDIVLIVANLSGRPQPVELNLAALDGADAGRDARATRASRRSGASRTSCRLGPHGFYWLRLEGRQRRPVRYGIEDTAI